MKTNTIQEIEKLAYFQELDLFNETANKYKWSEPEYNEQFIELLRDWNLELSLKVNEIIDVLNSKT